MTLKKKPVFIGIILLLILASFFLSESLRNAIARKAAILKSQNEYEIVTKKARDLERQIALIKTHPEKYENLVRKELGYLKPGEKEVRFIKEKEQEKE